MSNPKISRRNWVKLASAGVVFGGSRWLIPEAARAAQSPGRSIKSCILLFMNGGPSQHHTFNLPTQNGDYQGMQTSVPGVVISEYLPRLGRIAHKLALLRSMSTGNSVHERARVLMHTGYNPIGTVAYPSIGNIASAELGQAESELPNFVTLYAGSDGLGSGPLHLNGPAYLGPRHAPLAVADPDRGIEFLRPHLDRASLDDAARLIDRMDQRFLEDYHASPAAAHRSNYQRALNLVNSTKAQAFDLMREPQGMRDAYGSSQFGKCCLAARRLVEAGIPFVEVTLDGWDDHGGTARNIARRSAYLDRAMATLIEDLEQRGLLETTLVVWMGEFGRTPATGTGYNQTLGGGHFARAWTTVLAGAGIRPGVVGRTDAAGGEVTDTPISAQDFLATICRALGIDFHKEYMTRENRPMRFLQPSATPIPALFA
jgi:uncharacterized protein (DUF1501 family)